jgi:hypothetical protein
MDRFFEELGGIPVEPGQPAPAASYPDPEEFARVVAAWAWRSWARRSRSNHHEPARSTIGPDNGACVR